MKLHIRSVTKTSKERYLVNAHNSGLSFSWTNIAEQAGHYSLKDAKQIKLILNSRQEYQNTRISICKCFDLNHWLY